MSTPMHYTQFSATRVLSGINAHTHIVREAQQLGLQRLFLLIDPFIAGTPLGNTIVNQLIQANIDLVVSTQVEPDPTEATIVALAQQAQHKHVDGVIAIGGGSAIDSAKAIALLVKKATLELSRFYFGGAQLPDATIPVIAVPTTAGTGSEITFVAIITQPESRRKLLIRHPALAPTVAVVDPQLSASMPASLTMATGMDALSHALEALTSTMASPAADALAHSAITTIVSTLPALIQNGDNLNQRQQMAEAATLAGYAFLSGRVHLGHAVGHALGGAFHLPHGTACMVLMPAILHHITPAVPAAIDRIAHHFQTTAPQLPAALQSFMHGCGMPRLGQLITTPTDHNILVDLIVGEERLIGLAPSAPTRKEWLSIIEAGW